MLYFQSTERFYTFDGFEYKISYGDQKFKYYYDR